MMGVEDKLAANDDDDWLGVRICAPLPVEFPEAYRLPGLRVAVSLILTEWNCVSRSFFKHYAVDSVQQALRNVIHNDGAFLSYSFFVSDVTPAFQWDAKWPLSRRGDERGICRRERVQGETPWDWEWDRTLFEICAQPKNPYEGRPCLRVGGRSRESANESWGHLARVLRRMGKSC